MEKKFYLPAVLIFLAFSVHANMLLVPMDSSQTNHLKAYGVVFRVLSRSNAADWLLNYRGGSFAMPDSPDNERECMDAGVSYELITNDNYNDILTSIGALDNNMAVAKLIKSPKIAVYTPKNEKPWDDAVTLALTYAGITYDKVYDDEILNGQLNGYDWLHLHHEDFTGQYGKFFSMYGSSAWYQQNQEEEEARAKSHGFEKVSKMKLEVCHRIRDFVATGGCMFAMCSATESFDIALAAEKTDICAEMYDHDPQDLDAQSKLDFSQCFAFENWHLHANPVDYVKSDIDVTFGRTIPKWKDFFTLTEYNAKLNPTLAMLCQNQTKSVKGFLGQTTAFNKKFIKPGVDIMGDEGNEAKYIHGNYGKGMWTWYGGHDPECYSHLVGDKPTDLSKYSNSPGYRLILNNLLLASTDLPAIENNIETVKVYPNPSSGPVNVILTGQLSGSAYLLFDETGKMVESGKLSAETNQLDISHLPDGLYLLQTGTTRIKILKEK